MSMPMSNIDKGGYVPPGFGAGYPPGSAPPSTSQGDSYKPGAYGFVPGQPQAGYAPVPQMPPYGEAPPNYGGQQLPYGGQQPPYGGQQPPYGGQQPPYGGQQPPYGGQQPPYGGQQPPYGGQQPPYGGQQPPYGGMSQPQSNGGGGFQPAPGYAPQGPIVTQPGMPPPAQPMGPPGQPMGPAGDWMSIPAGIPNCPRGLEYLTMVDQLLVKQKVELLEAFTGFETNNKFSIKNALGQKVYYAVEDNDCCTRNMCGPARPFDMKVFDNFRNKVIHMYRPLACSACCFPCCLQTMEVSSPPGSVVGSIEQEWSICAPSFRIKNHIGDTVLRIEGPVCTFTMCGDVEFKVVSLTGETVGKISKQWSGLAREIFTDADFFGITFPMDLDVRMKAVLLGATFLIDAMFFEKQANRETDRPGMF
ncbi:phospholipid scramblase 1 isoform X1 [Ceratitis capitata]|uniref:phospholipid scramblase 1 isoform X1 n=1 Tax=Ceratitis capitata TaxID=7213 RepID=UPI000329B433|nr:phospholipid scramblase 1 isoform X1 [Ceratitis capitata]